MRSFIALLALLASAPAILAQFDCQSSSSIPYCVHKPDGASGALPMMVFMPGSGARGSLDNAASLATYDGLGKMISEYYSGNTDEPHTLAATKFLAVVPISPDGTRHFWPEDIKGIIDDVRSKHQVLGKKVGISGYSMGARGCNRFTVTYPDMVSSAGCSAGAAEQSGDGTLTQDPSRTASATFPLLSNAVKVPMQLFAGMSDTTAGYTSTEAEYNELKKLGAKSVQLVELQGADHSAMSTKPWSDTGYLAWALKIATSSGSNSGGSKTSKSPTAEPTKKHPTKASSTAVATPTSSSDGDDDDLDCDDSDDTDNGDDEDDCDDEEEEEDSNDGDDSDCDENSSDAGSSSEDSNTQDEEDCQEDDESANITRRSLPQVEAPIGRQSHHFVFPHSRRDWRSAPPAAHRARAIAAQSHGRMVRLKRH